MTGTLHVSRSGWLIMAVFLLAGCSQQSRTTAGKMAAVENRLLPTGSFPPWAGEELAARMKAHRVPGVSLAVMENYRLVWAKGYGVMESGTGRPVTPDTLFPAVGNSSFVTRYVTMILMERGKLAPEDQANGRLTSWQIPASAFTAKQEVTVHSLLMYDTSGLNGFENPGYPPRQPLPALLQVLEGVPPAITPPVRMVAEPGSIPARSRSSVTSYIVLQQLLEDVEGQPYSAIAARLLLEPLGLKASTFVQPLPEDRWPQAVTCHDGETPLPEKWMAYPETAAMGFWTTPSEFARLLGEVGRSCRGLSGELVSRATVAKIFDPDQLFYRLFSSARGCSSEIIFNPATGQGLVLMMNSGAGSGPLHDEILHTVFKEYRWTWGRGLIWNDTFKQGWLLALALILPALMTAVLAGLYFLNRNKTAG